MTPVRNLLAKLKCSWQRIDPSSLQFRLTIGVTLVSLLGLGGLATWTSWKTQQLMFGVHRQSLDTITQQLPLEAETIAPPTMPAEERLQLLLDRWSSEEMWLWAMLDNGEVIFSDDFPDPQMQPVLLSLAQVPNRPQILEVDGRHLVLCKVSVVLPDATSDVVIAKDVTDDYIMLLTLTRNLGIGTVTAIALLTSASTVFIWRSLHPLRQTRLACTQAISSPTQGRLDPALAPGEMKHLAETWNQLLDRIAETGEQQRQFTSGVSHELRTPLSIVYGYLQVTLRRGSNLTPQQREALQIATAETEHTIRLLQDLLDLARADGGGAQIKLETVVLKEVVDELISMSDRYRQRRLEIRVPDGSVAALADRYFLNQALGHLFNNACQFSDPSTPIQVTITQTETMAQIAIRDQGSGIPADQQSRVFEPFYRVDPSRTRTTGGVGVGLAIARALIRGMGGQITLTSVPGEGSTFTIHLLRAQDGT
jgi:hypothetical protein